MFALSARQPLYFYYWLISLGFVLIVIGNIDWRFKAILTESAHHLHQQQHDSLSVHQVMFLPTPRQTKIVEYVEESYSPTPILPLVQTGTFTEVKKSEPKKLKPKNVILNKPIPLKKVEKSKETEPLQPVNLNSQLASKTTESPTADLSPHTASSQAGNTQALSQSGTGQGQSVEDYTSALRKEIERHKHYPTQAKRMIQEGDVGLSFLLNNHGVISDIKVTQSSGFSSLDNAALKAIKRVKPIGPKPSHLPNILNVTLYFKLD